MRLIAQEYSPLLFQTIHKIIKSSPNNTKEKENNRTTVRIIQKKITILPHIGRKTDRLVFTIKYKIIYQKLF